MNLKTYRTTCVVATALKFLEAIARPLVALKTYLVQKRSISQTPKETKAFVPTAEKQSCGNSISHDKQPTTQGGNMSTLKELTLENFSNGAAKELFERELKGVLENVNDRNTKAEAPRTITLKFTVKPDAEREQLGLFVESNSKLAPVKGASGMAYFGRHNGQPKAYSNDINQMELDVESKPQAVRNEA